MHLLFVTGQITTDCLPDCWVATEFFGSGLKESRCIHWLTLLTLGAAVQEAARRGAGVVVFMGEGGSSSAQIVGTSGFALGVHTVGMGGSIWLGESARHIGRVSIL